MQQMEAWENTKHLLKHLKIWDEDIKLEVQ